MSRNPSKPKAYSYIRMSTDIQLRGDSHRRQLKLSKDYALANGLDLVETLEDIGVSAFMGLNRKEGALAGFIALLEADKIPAGSYLLVESLDRMSREAVTKAFPLFTRILERKVTIVTLADGQVFTEETLTTNVGQMFTTLGIMFRANEESRIKSTRLSAAWANKRQNTDKKKLTSICPAWLKLNRSTNEFDLVEKMAKSVRAAFDLSIQGYGAAAICQKFNNDPKSYPPNDKKKGWHKSYIQKILANPATFGAFQAYRHVGKKRVPDGDLVEGYFPAVVTREQFELSQARAGQRRVSGARRKGEGFANLFTRIAVCGSCGSVAVFRNKGAGPRGGKYLRCGDAERGRSCRAPAWRYEDFEASFFRFVREVDLEEILNGGRAQYEREQIVQRLDRLEHSRAALEGRFQNLVAQMSETSPELAQELRKSAERLIVERSELDGKISDEKRALITLDGSHRATDIKESIEKYQDMLRKGASVEVGVVRHDIHSALRQMIAKIILQNTDVFVAGDDISELDRELRTAIASRRYKTEVEQVSYLLTEAGQRLYNEHCRAFVVSFRSGVSKLVQPLSGLVMDFKPSRVL